MPLGKVLLLVCLFLGLAWLGPVSLAYARGTWTGARPGWEIFTTIPTSYTNLAPLYTHLGLYDSALIMLNEGYRIGKPLEDKRDVPRSVPINCGAPPDVEDTNPILATMTDC